MAKTITKHKVYLHWFNHSDPALRQESLKLCIRWQGHRNWLKLEPSYFEVAGTLEALLKKYLEGLYVARTSYQPPATPAGIYIDRLQECPEELVGATPEQVDAILTYLRQRHPNGV